LSVSGVAGFPQLQLQWKTGQQLAKQVGGEAVARLFIVNSIRYAD